ncbi:MAG: hypothetical protein M3537_05635 [Chloroflexota bacterium]|nr:hypothetical protein [Chloroflexota bacterium]
MPSRTPVTPPIATAARTGLIGAVGITDEPQERWEQGIAYRPRQYISEGAFNPRNCSPQDLALTSPPDVVEWDAYGIWGGELCQVARPEALGELRQGVVNMLEVQASDKIEYILWSNDAGGDMFPPNVGLASPLADSGATVVGGGSLGVVPAWSALIKALKVCLGGARGMIHVPVWATPWLDFYGLLTRVGNQLFTKSADHIVIAGAGYSGTGPGNVAPDAGFAWFYATTPVQVRLGPIQSSGDWDQFNRATNAIEVRAWAPALASWDRECHLAVEVCLEDPGPLCSGS